MHKGKHHLFDDIDKHGNIEDSQANLDDEFYKSLKFSHSAKKIKFDTKT